MMKKVRVYAQGSDGKLLAYDVSEAASFAEAIEMVKEAAGSPRALCLVNTTRDSNE